MIKIRILNIFKGMDNRWELYKFIDKNPRLTIYELSKEMNWSIKKIKYYIKRILKEGLIKTKNRTYSAKDWKELINWDEMDSKPEDWKD